MGDIGFPCDLCHQSAGQGPIVTPCGHLYCESCNSTWVQPVRICPVCGANLDPRAQLLALTPNISVPSVIVGCLFKIFIWFGEGLLLGMVDFAANRLYSAVDRRFPDLIDVVEERDNVDGEGSENGNGSNVAAEVMDNVNGEESGGNEIGDSETVEMIENTNGEAVVTDNGSNGEGEVRDNNGDGSSSLTVVHPIGGLIPFV